MGNLLKTNGIISGSDLEKALAESKEKKQKIGKTLVENDLISSEDLKFYIHKQIEEIMFKLFFWEKGEFEYVDSDIDMEGMVVIQLDILRLILEATRRIDEMSIFKKQIPTDRLVLKITDKLKDHEEIKLNANEFRMVALIDGTRNVRDLINMSDYDEFVTYKIIYALLCSGLIEKSDEVRPNKSEKDKGLLFITTVYADILQVIFRKMEANLGKRAQIVFDQCLREIESNMEKLKEDSGEKDYIVQEIQKIMLGIKQQNKTRLKLKTKPRKIFSIFKK